MREDLQNYLSTVNTIVPARRNAGVTGTTVSLSNFRGAVFVATVGDVVDGTHTLVAQHFVNAAWVNVPANELQGAFVALAANTVQEVGYLGTAVDVRVNSTSSGATGADYNVAVVRGAPRRRPV